MSSVLISIKQLVCCLPLFRRLQIKGVPSYTLLPEPGMLAHDHYHPEMRTTTLWSFTRQTPLGITLSLPGSFISMGDGTAVSMTLSHRFSCKEGISKSRAICSILSITCRSSSCDKPQMVKASIRPLGSCQSGVNSWRPCQSISLTPCSLGPSVKKRSRRTFG